MLLIIIYKRNAKHGQPWLSSGEPAGAQQGTLTLDPPGVPSGPDPTGAVQARTNRDDVVPCEQPAKPVRLPE